MNNDLMEKYVLQVAETQSLTRAAQKLGISQPALTQALNGIEKRLGYSLFNRRSNPVTLTREGEVYLDYLRSRTVLQKEYEKRISDVRAARNLSLVVGAPEVYAGTVVTDALARFSAEHPECDVKIRIGTLPALERMAARQEVDCFISTSGDISSDFERVEIQKEQICLCIPTSWELGSTFCIDQPEQLNGRSCILLEPTQPLYRAAVAFFREHDIHVKKSITVDQVALSVKLAAKGVGMTFASREALQYCGESDRLCPYELSSDLFRRPVYACYDRTRYVSEACRRFMDILIHAHTG